MELISMIQPERFAIDEAKVIYIIFTFVWKSHELGRYPY